MGKLSGRTIVLAALCAGLLAALLAYLFLDRQRVQAARMTEPVQVVVATQDIPARTVIEPGMVAEATRPAATLPSNPATRASEVVGQVTLTALKAQQPLQRGSVSWPSAALGLAHVVPQGMRAVTVALDPIIGVAGFLKAGDHVDVLATFDVDRLGITKTVLQDVELLAIGAEVVPAETPDSDKAGRPKEQPNATLALYPEDAEKLILAESEGKLRLTLRPMGDSSMVTLAGTRSDHLIGLRRAVTAAEAASPRPTARVMSAEYTSPAFMSDHAAAMRFPPVETRPQAVTFADRPQFANDALEKTVTVETVRGTQKTTVDVRAE